MLGDADEGEEDRGGVHDEDELGDDESIIDVSDKFVKVFDLRAS